MSFAKVINNQVVEYPVYEGDIILQNPNTSFSVPFSPPDEYIAVEESQPPLFNQYTHTVVEKIPAFIDGVLTRQWEVQELDEETKKIRKEAKGSHIKQQRNALLKMSDWTQLEDAPVDKEAWKEYRQKLRDLTLQEDFPFNVQWPSQP